MDVKDHWLVFSANSAVGIRHGSGGADCIDDIHAGKHAAKSSITAVKVNCVCMTDKELGGCTVICSGACHGQYTAGMGERILKTVCSKLSGNGLIASAGSVAVGVTTLNHETGDNPVKSEPVIKALIGKMKKVGDGCRGKICIKFSLNGAIIPDFDGNIMRAGQVFRLCFSGNAGGIGGRNHNGAENEAEKQNACLAGYIVHRISSTE